MRETRPTNRFIVRRYDGTIPTSSALVVVLLATLATLASRGDGDTPEGVVTVDPGPTATATPVPEQATRAASNSAFTPLPPGKPSLYRAIWAGTIDEVTNLVAAGADVNADGGDGEPLLYTAIWRAEPEKVQILVDAGADLNARDADGDPLLYTAVWREKPEALNTLIASGADVNLRGANGESLLYVARWRGHTEIEQILVAAGATE